MTTADLIEIDVPRLTETPSGWLATSTDEPRIGVFAPTSDGALAMYRERRAWWRSLASREVESS